WESKKRQEFFLSSVARSARFVFANSARSPSVICFAVLTHEGRQEASFPSCRSVNRWACKAFNRSSSRAGFCHRHPIFGSLGQNSYESQLRNRASGQVHGRFISQPLGHPAVKFMLLDTQ